MLCHNRQTECFGGLWCKPLKHVPHSLLTSTNVLAEQLRSLEEHREQFNQSGCLRWWRLTQIHSTTNMHTQKWSEFVLWAFGIPLDEMFCFTAFRQYCFRMHTHNCLEKSYNTLNHAKVWTIPAQEGKQLHLKTAETSSPRNELILLLCFPILFIIIFFYFYRQLLEHYNHALLHSSYK